MTTTLKDFIATTGLRMNVKPADGNLNMADSATMDHWRCTIIGRGRMTVPFSMGSGHNGKEPDLESVLDCLASDANSVSLSFADFCGELGYDNDSRKAERIYKTCQRQAAKLHNLLGSQAYDDLLYNCERL